jgi:hypothetical protein
MLEILAPKALHQDENVEAKCSPFIPNVDASGYGEDFKCQNESLKRDWFVIPLLD